MRLTRPAAAVAVAATLALAPATAASAHDRDGGDLRGAAVFVQLNGGAQNSVAAFVRSRTGELTPAGRYATGGQGAKQVGAPVDALASQGGLARSGNTLIAVNAGSGTVAALAIGAHTLQLTSVVSSGGQFPSSVAVDRDRVYVLNAGGSGTVSGFTLVHQRLVPIPGASADLQLGNDPVPGFLASPSQLGLTPDGRTLVVATKSHNTLVTFPVRRNGSLGAALVTASTGPVPFSFVFDRAGRLQVTQAGDGATASYAVARDSALVPLGVSASDGQAALCWNVQVGRFLYGANAGSATLSAWRLRAGGTAVLVAPVAATTSAGPIDLAATHDGRFIYVLSALTGGIDAFATRPDGSLVAIGTTTGLPVIDDVGGPEGIVVR
jgi:6-phosphogluconolactonase (cycloisomerase 2 family)